MVSKFALFLRRISNFLSKWNLIVTLSLGTSNSGYCLKIMLNSVRFSQLSASFLLQDILNIALFTCICICKWRDSNPDCESPGMSLGPLIQTEASFWGLCNSEVVGLSFVQFISNVVLLRCIFIFFLLWTCSFPTYLPKMLFQTCYWSSAFRLIKNDTMAVLAGLMQSPFLFHQLLIILNPITIFAPTD